MNLLRRSNHLQRVPPSTRLDSATMIGACGTGRSLPIGRIKQHLNRNLLIFFLIMGFFSGLFGADKPKKDASFPPVPDWEPEIKLPMDKIIDRFSYYTDGKKDFVLFTHGTCVIISDKLSDEDAEKEAIETLVKIFNYHPDMNPVSMDDGNLLVQYNHPAYNVVLDEITRKYMKTIEANHRRALARDEVLITSLGPNKFDEFGMKALFGRCYFFMDAKKPAITKIIRKTNQPDSAVKPTPSR